MFVNEPIEALQTNAVGAENVMNAALVLAR